MKVMLKEGRRRWGRKRASALWGELASSKRAGEMLTRRRRGPQVAREADFFDTPLSMAQLQPSIVYSKTYGMRSTAPRFHTV